MRRKRDYSAHISSSLLVSFLVSKYAILYCTQRLDSTNDPLYSQSVLASILPLLFVVRPPFNRATVFCWGRTIDGPMGLVDFIGTVPALRSNDTVEPYSKIGRWNPNRKYGRRVSRGENSRYYRKRLQHPRYLYV